MFTWSIAKSAEAMFSRWAVKRLCKFLLKKKLGQFILGDIDLNQLDVQLRAGTIQLSDLALNVDYINHKFGTAAVFVKEGSIGSLKVTMPWKDGGCRIELDELEVVLAPRRVKVSEDKHESCSDTKKDHTSFSHVSSKLENEVVNSELTNVSVDVHEGVKTIAKMVRWLLTSFHVQIKKLIVAFDPLLEEEDKKRLDRTLVLRIGEVECGTHISEDSSSGSSTKVHNFLGFSRLTSFMKFHGVVLELIHMDGLDHQSPPEVLTETPLVDWFSGHCPSGSMTTIVYGEKGGFSGNLKLSVPWKNGSLDICKVNADLNIEPLELRLQPSTIRCFIFLWDIFKDIGEECKDYNNNGLQNSSSAPSYCIPPHEGILSNEGFDDNFYMMEKEPTNALLSESHLIPDWVSKSQKDRSDKEPDFGASVDQFFECFDGLRNSQSALGNSGMWNWTCSVFSAITAASNLASGSLHVTCEQQQVETNFNVSISKISLHFSLADEDQKEPSKTKNDEGDAAFHIRCVCAQLVDLWVVFQVCPREMKFESTVQHIQLIDHLYSKNESVSVDARCCNGNSKSEISLIQQMQDDVQSTLRTFEKSNKDQGLDRCSGCFVDISLTIQESNGCCSHILNRNDFHGRGASVKLLQTSGISQCHVTVNSGSSGSLLLGPTSFSLKLAPFVFWVNFDLIIMMLDILNEMARSVEQTATESGFVLKSEGKRYSSSPGCDQGKISIQQAPIIPKKSLEATIFIPNARIILCFPLRGHKDFSSYLCGEQFIVFDIVSSNFGGKEIQSAKPKLVETSNKRDVMAASCSLRLYLGNLFLFYITSTFVDKGVDSGTYRQDPRFVVEKIASVTKGTGHLPLICMFWQEGAVTGHWIAKKAKLLACPAENAKSKDNPDGKGFEFASVTTIKDIADFDTHCQQEIRPSSTFFFHAQLPPITIDLGKDQYENICGLLNQVIEHFSCMVPDPVHTGEEDSTSQTSVLVECSSLTVSVNIEPACDIKYSALKELPGSWHSLTLQVNKFQLLSVSNIGGIRNTNFLWVSHGHGSLWGSITKGLQREFLLISCDDSTMGRGNGEGSNVLSSKYSGSEIINLWDRESNHNFTSITVRSATLIAIGGRLDWFNTIICFFSLPSSESDQAGDKNLDKRCGSSFVLNLVDVGLNYEPHFRKLMAGESSDCLSSEINASEAMDELYVSCLLAASSLKLSSASVDDCTAGEHRIRLQDLGLLLCTVSEPKLGGTYSAEHLRKTGYVKVAQEENVEALLRTNCENGHAWELECDESHIVLNTCHDTTLGLVRLAAQLQKLFAPDMQEHVVHLENRWINAQLVHENMDERTLGNKSPPSVSHTQTSSLDNRPKTGNLMDEICEDVFHLDGKSDGQAKFFEPHLQPSSTDISFGEQCFGDPEHLSAELPHARNFSTLGVGANMGTSLDEKFPELIEEYFLSDLRPLSELAVKSQPSDMFYCKTRAVGVAQTGNCGWYEDTSLRILENHASKVNEQSNIRLLVEIEASSSDSKIGEVGKAEGCIIFMNMNVVWRMYGGSDWSNLQNISQPSAMMSSGRDATICFELALSGIGFDYKFYPDGEISTSRLSLTVQDFCLNDKSDHAPWKLVLGYYHSKKHPRMFSSKAVKLNLDAVKPDPSIPLEENRLRIALLPMRLHLHQSQLDFLINFFGNNNSSSEPSASTPSVSNKLGEQPEKKGIFPGPAISEEAFLPYFQKFDIWPLLIRVDYSPCHFDLTALSGGKYVELVNLVPWKDVELQLKHVQGVGLYGWNSVCEMILGEWLEDISKNQIHKLLKGLPPIKSLVAVGSGAAKLVSLPVKNYRKDQRLIKGMQRGTIAFLRSISLEAIGLGVHLAGGAHNILLQAEYILTNIPPSVPWQVESRVAATVRSNQPKDAQQGIHQACQSITDGLGKSASALVQTPLKKLQRGAGVGSTLATAVQATPAAAIAPASAAAHAVHCALLGFRNSLDPERKRESLEKYLGRAPPRESMQ